MISVDLLDPHLIEHLEAIKTMKKLGYGEEEIQESYDKQRSVDNERSNNNHNC